MGFRLVCTASHLILAKRPRSDVCAASQLKESCFDFSLSPDRPVAATVHGITPITHTLRTLPGTEKHLVNVSNPYYNLIANESGHD